MYVCGIDVSFEFRNASLETTLKQQNASFTRECKGTLLNSWKVIANYVHNFTIMIWLRNDYAAAAHYFYSVTILSCVTLLQPSFLQKWPEPCSLSSIMMIHVPNMTHHHQWPHPPLNPLKVPCSHPYHSFSTTTTKVSLPVRSVTNLVLVVMINFWGSFKCSFVGRLCSFQGSMCLSNLAVKCCGASVTCFWDNLDRQSRACNGSGFLSPVIGSRPGSCSCVHLLGCLLLCPFGFCCLSLLPLLISLLCQLQSCSQV